MDKLTPEILQRLDALAAKFGVTVQYLWGVTVRQARVEAYESLFWFFLLNMVSVVILKLLAVMRKKNSELSVYEQDRGLVNAFDVAGGLAIVALTVASFANLDHAITPLFNPEYWAFQQFMSILK